MTVVRCWIQHARFMGLHGNLSKVPDRCTLCLHQPARSTGKFRRLGQRAWKAFGFVFKLRDWLSSDGAQGHRFCAKRYPDIDDTGRNILPQSPHRRCPAHAGIVDVRRLDAGNVDVRNSRLPRNHFGALLTGINGLQLKRLNSSIPQRCPSGLAAESSHTPLWNFTEDALAKTKQANISHGALLVSSCAARR